ncbi:M15 family metallopeptidase [Nocardioides panacisoli]|uniref:M15 family metallopeptidase n=1 Tax=Nocardioides panacisoli TaxID=627624 RepID=UPI001C6248D6|nr:M15 family metallopeptidase [Nocardioides panacisoli]QYJ03202.1 M15 family metallopeptidase [Nocardioides panacisoli]
MDAARVRGLVMAAMAASLLLAACGSSETGTDGPAADGTTAASAPASPSGDATADTASDQPSYDVPTVDEPPKDPGRLVGDDMLVVGRETLADDLVAELEQITVKGKKAVDATERMSIGQISAEGEVYDVAAVDLAGYRRFTQRETVQFTDQWQRLAGGEFAAAADLEGQLPLDEKGYLAAGSGEDVHQIHAGAWAPQAAGVDIVVNEGWGEELGLVPDNAVLISTGALAPQAVRQKVKKVVGKGYSIQDLDIVKEAGLDPDAAQIANVVGTFGDAVGTFRYRPIGGGRIAPDPAWVSANIVTEQVPILGKLTCNKSMMPQLKAALREVIESDLADEINYHVGCYYPRFIAGSTKLSNHSFGLAIDINSRENQRGTVGQMHRGVVAIFKRWGFAWGGDWSYTDPMHFELSQIKQPG